MLTSICCLPPLYSRLSFHKMFFLMNEGLQFSVSFFLKVHCVWAAAEAYSAPSIVLTSHSHDGLHVFDDFREAYAWLSHNTEVDDKVSVVSCIFLYYTTILFYSTSFSLLS